MRPRQIPSMPRWLWVVMSLTLPACSAVDLSSYEDNRPEFVLDEFFQGDLTAHGIVKNRGGAVIRHFNATIDASWDEQGVGTLDEIFYFDDGEVQHRIWTLTPDGERQFQAQANDVTGTAQARTSGNAMAMRYTLQVPYRGRTVEVTVDDRMFLMNEQVVINESTMRKFGFRVGSVLLTILKAEE